MLSNKSYPSWIQSTVDPRAQDLCPRMHCGWKRDQRSAIVRKIFMFCSDKKTHQKWSFWSMGFSLCFYWNPWNVGRRWNIFLHFCLRMSTLGWFHKTSWRWRRYNYIFWINTVQTYPMKPTSKDWVMSMGRRAGEVARGDCDLLLHYDAQGHFLEVPCMDWAPCCQAA